MTLSFYTDCGDVYDTNTNDMVYVCNNDHIADLIVDAMAAHVKAEEPFLRTYDNLTHTYYTLERMDTSPDLDGQQHYVCEREVIQSGDWHYVLRSDANPNPDQWSVATADYRNDEDARSQLLELSMILTAFEMSRCDA